MIPVKHLEDLGFMEIAENLFMKDLGSGIKLYRDYRNEQRSSYAYRYDHKIPKNMFKELRAIEKIERHIMSNTLMAYC